MLSSILFLSGLACFCLSGLPACFLTRHPRIGQSLSVIMMFMGSSLGIGSMALHFWYDSLLSLDFDWFLPWGRFSIALDPLSAIFLLLVLVIPCFASLYGLGYGKSPGNPQSSPRLLLAIGWLTAGMALVLLARDGILFLIAWEIMALSAFFAATNDDHDPKVRRAGWVYLIATHIGTLCLFSMFVLWSQETGSFTLSNYGNLAVPLADGLFILALIGFGFKAGLMPLHVWLPAAHANAPSHVSAIMSGVMLKMGVYGILRLASLIPNLAEWWGPLLIGLGGISALFGIIFALAQRDLKRLLAYSSIENIGIVVMGIGLALLGRQWHRPDWLILGLGAALLQVWNHGLFKPLLFFNAGALIRSTHTRQIDQFGGFARQTPWLASLFLIGALAIAALPPLNGFVGEWLLYIGLFGTLQSGPIPNLMAVASAAVALAMVGSLALICFIKVGSSIYLGSARSDTHNAVRDPGPSLLIPMIVPATACLVIGLVPSLVFPVLDAAIVCWAGLPTSQVSLTKLVPVGWISWLGMALVGLILLLVLLFRLLPRSSRIERQGTWDCGYAQPDSRMQYHGSSLVQNVVRFFAIILRPQAWWPRLKAMFPASSNFHSTKQPKPPNTMRTPILTEMSRLACTPLWRVLTKGAALLFAVGVIAAGTTVATAQTAPAAPTLTTVTPGNAALTAALTAVFTAGSDGGSPITDYQYSSDNASTWKSTPFSPPSGPATGSCNGLHRESNFLALCYNLC